MVNISEKQLVTQTENYIKDVFADEGSGHDWWHIHRVRNLSVKIAEAEGGNRFVIEMAALLHDIDDWKITGDKQTSNAELWLKNINVSEAEVNKILEIIGQVSFKGAQARAASTARR